MMMTGRMTTLRRPSVHAVLAVVMVLLLAGGTGGAAAALSSRAVGVVVQYPEANLQGQRLYLRGDGLGLNWSTGRPMQRVGTDRFAVSLEVDGPAAAADHAPSGTQVVQMKALVADQYWQVGANHVVSVPPSGDFNTTLYPWFWSSSGRYFVINNIRSPQLGNTRDMVVYVPPSYYENPYKSYELLVMHDGQNLFNDSTAFMGQSWGCGDTLNGLIVQGRVREIVVAGPYNTPDRIAEYTYSRDPTQSQCCKGDQYLDFVSQTVVPLIRQQFRIVPGRVGVLGSSLGGLISCYAGWTRPHTFSQVGCMSSSFWWNNEDFNTTIIPGHPVPRSSVFYLDSGDSGPDNDDVVQTQTVTKHMVSVGLIPEKTLFYYLDRGGRHSEQYWGRRFWVPMVSLYPAPSA